MVEILSLKTVYNWKGVEPPSSYKFCEVSDSVSFFRGPHGNAASLISREVIHLTIEFFDHRNEKLAPSCLL